MFAHPIFVFSNRLLREAIAGPDQSSFLIAVMLCLYAAMLLIFCCYGAHRWAIVLRYLKARKNAPAKPLALSDEALPGVTVQLPLFNEMFVVDRLIDSVAALDYPKDRLQIQVLDDSTDETTSVAEAAVRRHQARGIDIELIHRTDRTGYKAGALDQGLRRAKHGLAAIFDADFVPPQDFLKRAVGYFRDERVGAVQGRWGHFNEDASYLTKAQGLMLNGHFMVEHPARNRNGLFFNFNGTAGIWRVSTIADAGGWEHDTLTEDLDLSYRAQLKGWRFVYDNDLVCPSELPMEMNAFKSQQHRWSKGSIQVMRKLLPTILRSRLPLRVKVESFFHLTGNLCFLLMVPMFLLSLPMLLLRTSLADGSLGAVIDWSVFGLTTGSVIAFYSCTAAVGYRHWWKRLHLIPMMVALAVGISINQCRAVLEALLGHQSEFVRTPKFATAAGGEVKRYRGAKNLVRWIELAFAAYATVLVSIAVSRGLWGALPFFGILFLGFWYVCLLSLFQSRSRTVAIPKLDPAGATASA